MRYPNCEKVKAFNLFDQGKRPAEIFKLIKVKEHTLFNYFQEWKREKEKEYEEKRLVVEHKQRMDRKNEERKRKEEEEFGQPPPDIILREQFQNQRKIVLEMEASMERAYRVPNNEVQANKIEQIYSQEYEKFREITRKLYPELADEAFIWRALHYKAR